MKVISKLHDNRISAWNVLVEIDTGDYAELVKDNLRNNEFQRKRVSSSKTVYSLLKADLLTGCVIPPVVLALNSNVGDSNLENLEDLIVSHSDGLVILDGLQRTHTILDLLEELKKSGSDELEKVERAPLRVEVYIGLNRLGILYRMLTLNTGQTPMSLRQQIEMLYSDYIGADLDGAVQLIRESDGKYATGLHDYVFKDVVEGFNAYLNRDELPFDRTGLLENIRSLEKLSKENSDSEIFKKYLAVLDTFMTRVVAECGEAELAPDWQEDKATPFGKNVTQVFKKAQAMSGLGAALGKLMDRDILSSLDESLGLVGRVSVENPDEFLVKINSSLDWLKNNTSKIGNAQRNFFTFFFRDLLNEESDGFLSLDDSAESALRKYQDQNI